MQIYTCNEVHYHHLWMSSILAVSSPFSFSQVVCSACNWRSFWTISCECCATLRSPSSLDLNSSLCSLKITTNDNYNENLAGLSIPIDKEDYPNSINSVTTTFLFANPFLWYCLHNSNLFFFLPPVVVPTRLLLHQVLSLDQSAWQNATIPKINPQFNNWHKNYK